MEGEIIAAKAKKNTNALNDIKAQVKLLLTEVEELHVSEADVKFGINTAAEFGNIVIDKISVVVNH